MNKTRSNCARQQKTVNFLLTIKQTIMTVNFVIKDNELNIDIQVTNIKKFVTMGNHIILNTTSESEVKAINFVWINYAKFWETSYKLIFDNVNHICVEE